MPSQFDKDELGTLLSQAAAGDQYAWKQLVEAYSRRIFGLIRARCNDPNLAEEITQSTFCTLAAKLQDYKEVGKFESWLFRIAVNRLRDEMRRRKRQATPVADDTLSGLHASSSQSMGSASLGDDIDPEITSRLRGALSELPDADQKILQLRHFGDLSFKQIAEILNEPLGTVLARQHRALRKLREVMERGDYEPD
jgi:RNA polymerase sigma-70 factor (ECF subfamily)